MVTKRTDYTAEAVEAPRSVMIELTRLLGEYREGIAIVGGWVPELLLSGRGELHTGSLDVDLALDQATLGEIGYKSILELLRARGYQQGEQPFIFFRSVSVGGNPYEVEVDFLAGEYGGTGRSRRTQKIQDMQPRKARGCDLAFINPDEVSLHGTLPGGGRDDVMVRVASIGPFLVMKGIAMAGRLKEKDAWDIYYCLRNYPGGVRGLANEFRPLLKNSLAQEALKDMSEKFASPEHSGPNHVADFEEINDEEERERVKRDAYERVQALLKLLK